MTGRRGIRTGKGREQGRLLDEDIDDTRRLAADGPTDLHVFADGAHAHD